MGIYGTTSSGLAVTLLVTNMKEVGVNKFIAVNGLVNKEYNVTLQKLEKGTKEHLKANVIFVTDCQRDDAWFHLRRYRVTSTSASKFLGFAYKDTNTNPIIKPTLDQLCEALSLSQCGIQQSTIANLEHTLNNNIEINRKLSKKQLKQALAQNGIAKGISALNKDGLCTLLAGCNGRLNRLLDEPTSLDELSTTETENANVITRVIASWHLTVPKSASAQEALRKGIQNEPRVLKTLPSFFQKHGILKDNDCADDGVRVSYSIIGKFVDPSLITKVENGSNERLFAASCDMIGTLEIKFGIENEFGDIQYDSPMNLPIVGESKMKPIQILLSKKAFTLLATNLVNWRY